MNLCRHCNVRPRRADGTKFGLCWKCYNNKAVRVLYTYMDRRKEAFDSCLPVDPRPLPTPTDAEPGSAAKLTVLCHRALYKQALHHPKDVGWFGSIPEHVEMHTVHHHRHTSASYLSE